MNADDLAPRHVSDSDLRFFARHPERQYRARRPFRSEIERLGKLPPLKPGCMHVVIASKLSKTQPYHFLTEVFTIRPGDGKPPRLPKTDADISRAFANRKAPAPTESVPA